MSGLALAFDFQEALTSEDKSFTDLKKAVITFKRFNPICHEIKRERFILEKLDTATTRHRGVTVDEQTGSWLVAAGIVLNSENGSGHKSLLPLLKNYLKHGNSILDRLDGAFVLVIYNKPANRLVVITDPLGFYAVFFARRGKRVYVATSALAVAEVVQAQLSEKGAYQFLSTGSVYGRSTLWDVVQRLPAGTVLEFNPNECNESVYWLPSRRDEITRLSLSDTVDEAIDTLSYAVREYILSEGTTWVDLTGGFDSRLVTALMLNSGANFLASCEGPLSSSDVRLSSRIAQEMGWNYRHVMLPDDWGQARYERLYQALGRGDGHYDVFKLSRVSWVQEQRAPVLDTSICGLGGELWRGFFWKQELLNIGKSSEVDYDRLVDYRILHPIDSTVFSLDYDANSVREELKSLLKSIGDRYADLPNTFKLDCIYAFKNMGHTGAHISSVAGLQRVITPLFLKSTMTFAISTNHKWRNHSRLVRMVIEKVNPVLASFETTSGGPAAPMRLTNFQKFIPYWSGIGKQLIRKASRSVLGHSILPVTRDEFADYPLHQWRLETLNCLEQNGVLDYSRMRSGHLYNAEQLTNFFKSARKKDFNQETFLSRILTIEMAMRAVQA